MSWRVIAFPIVAALLGTALGYAAARWVASWLGWALCGACLGGAAVMLVQAQSSTGMDGLGQVVLAVLGLAPAGLGAALGTVFAAMRAARRGG